MSTPRKSFCAASLLALALASPSVAAAPSPRSLPGPTPGPAPAPQPVPAPSTSFVGRLIASPDVQGAEVDLGVITSIRYAFSSANQTLLISASSEGKSNLCAIQFNSIEMAKNRPGWTRAEPLETYREVVAAARTPGGKILCVAPISTGSKGSIGRVSFDGSFVWVVLGDKSSSEFQIVVH